MTVKRIWIICSAIILIFIVSSCGNVEAQETILAETATSTVETTEPVADDWESEISSSATECTSENEPTETSRSEEYEINSSSEEAVTDSLNVNTAELIEKVKKAYENIELYSYSIGLDKDTKSNDFTMLDNLFNGLSDYKFQVIPDPELNTAEDVAIYFGEQWSLHENGTPHIRFFNVDNGVLEFRDGNGNTSFYATSGVPYSGDSMYDWLVKNYYWVEARRMHSIAGSSPEEAVIKFITGGFFTREMQVSPENSQRVVNYSVLSYEITEISEDRNSVTVSLTYRVKPADINTYMYAGSVHRLDGDWEGWLENGAIFKLTYNEMYSSWEYEQVWN